MDGSGNWRLAPAYDVPLATYPLASGFRAARVMGKSSGIRLADLRELAEEQGVRHANEIIRQVMDAVGDWEKVAGEHGLPDSIIGQVALEQGFCDLGDDGLDAGRGDPLGGADAFFIFQDPAAPLRNRGVGSTVRVKRRRRVVLG